jgi:hypothetical protein
MLLHGFGASLYSWWEVVGYLSTYGDVAAEQVSRAEQVVRVE